MACVIRMLGVLKSSDCPRIIHYKQYEMRSESSSMWGWEHYNNG